MVSCHDNENIASHDESIFQIQSVLFYICICVDRELCQYRSLTMTFVKVNEQMLSQLLSLLSLFLVELMTQFSQLM